MISFQKNSTVKKVQLAFGYFALLFCFSITSVSAQVKAMYTILPKANIRSVDAPPGESAEIGMNILDISLGFPLYESFDEETGKFVSIENTLNFKRHSFDPEFPATGGVDEYFPKTLYGLNYSLAAVKSLNTKWFVVGFLSTGIFTDFENVESDHFIIEGGAAFARKYGEHITLGLGAGYSYAFGNPTPIPVIIAKYESASEKFILDVKIPQYASLNYRISEGFQTGIAIRPLYSNYSLGDDRAVDSNGESTAVVFSDITIALESSLLLFKPVSFDFALGTTVNRKLVVDDNEGHKLFDRSMDHSLFISFGLKAEF